MRILVVEDDAQISKGIEAGLKANSYAVDMWLITTKS